LQRALSLLEPFGMDNPEPVFTARAVRLMTPPQAVKDKHVRLRIAPASGRQGAGGTPALLTPRCHPDSAAIPKRRAEEGIAIEAAEEPSTTSSWRTNITFKAMGWGLKESCEQLQLLAGDRLDIAYTLGMNEHPEFGGLELTLRDVQRSG
jgi:single-stranded-DNA-specific exonuclease